MANVSSKRNDAITLSCVAKGDEPLNIVWSHNGARIDLNNYRYTSQTNQPNQTTPPTNLIKLLQTCSIIGNPCCISQFNPKNNVYAAMLIYIYIYIVCNSVSVVFLYAAASLCLPVSAIAPPATIRRRRCHCCCRLNIAEMKSGDGVNSQLSISRSDRHDSGPYKCTAENPFGKSEHTIYLAVQGNLSFMHARIRWTLVFL